MDKRETVAELILRALTEQERSKAWLARATQIPLTTLDRKLRGDGADITLAQLHAIAAALHFNPVEAVASEQVPA